MSANDPITEWSGGAWAGRWLIPKTPLKQLSSSIDLTVQNGLQFSILNTYVFRTEIGYNGAIQLGGCL